LMLYSHGDMGFGGDSAAISRHFASHGWVVVAPDHTDNTLIDTVAPRPTDHYLHRPLDLRASMDALEQLADTEPLSQVNTEAVMVTGHSFGCFSVWAVAGARFDADSLEQQCLDLEEGDCTDAQKEAFLSGVLADARISSAVTMGGSIRRGFFGSAGHLEVASPLMLMSGTEDNHGVPESWENLQPMDDLSWLELIGGCHQTFATGICSTLDPETGFALVGAYSLAQGRRDVLADASHGVQSLLSGERSLSDRASYSPASSAR